MSIQDGTLIKLYIGSVAVANLKSNDMKLARAMRDVSTKDSGGWKEQAYGQGSFDFSAEVLYDPGLDNTHYRMTDFTTAQINKTILTAVYSSAVTGETKYTGSVLVSSVDTKAPNEENVSFTVTLSGTGALAQATI
jgi:hypothetical protein